MGPELTRAVTNVVCSLCFNSSYRRGDPEFEAMLEYSQGIVDTVAKESLVDIFPWLQVSKDTGTASSSHLESQEGVGRCHEAGVYLSTPRFRRVPALVSHKSQYPGGHRRTAEAGLNWSPSL